MGDASEEETLCETGAFLCNAGCRELTFKRHKLGFAILRIVVGIVFLAHGAQKLFVHGFGGVTHMFAW